MSMAIRILIADDDARVRQGLRAVLSGEVGVEVVGEATDGDEAVALAQALRPDVLLLDLRMPRKDGHQALAELVDAAPSVRILILTAVNEDEEIVSTIAAGALGYVSKESAPQQLLAAIREAAGG
jgi:DNA-binding NarL/FixJ family response regulator